MREGKQHLTRQTDTDTREMCMTHTASAAFVLHPATHMLFYINSQCKQAFQFSNDHTI